MADYESVLCLKNEVFVYNIPARPSNRGYRAADWKLDEPDWSGRLRVVAKERELSIKLEDKNSGELFALCPVDTYPTTVVEQVLDSSRYFVIRIQNNDALPLPGAHKYLMDHPVSNFMRETFDYCCVCCPGRHAFIGLGFADRGDSFDLLVSLQDHFKQVKRDNTIKISESPAAIEATPKLDLSFKDGQTIKLNFSTKRTGDEVGAAKVRPKGQAAMSSALLPPPPGGSKVPLQQSRQPNLLPSSTSVQSPTVPSVVRGAPVVQPFDSFKQPMNTSLFHPPTSGNQFAAANAQKSSNVDLLLDLTPPRGSSTQPVPPATLSNNEWDDFSGDLASKLTIQPPTVKKTDPNILSWENFE